MLMAVTCLSVRTFVHMAFVSRPWGGCNTEGVFTVSLFVEPF